MTSRWEVERALRDSGLPAFARLAALTLLSRADVATCIIPAERSPSLTVLAHDTGLSRRSVMNALNTLESEGWVTRSRDLARAIKEKRPTGYRLHIPSRAGDALEQEVPQSTRAGDAPSRAGDALELGHEMHKVRAPGALNQNWINTDHLAALAVAEVLRHTGKIITEDDARRGIKIKIDGQQIRSPKQWLRKVIASDPVWWLPTPQPPHFRNGEFGS